MKTIFNQPKIPLLLIPISLGGIFLYQYLTFIPEYSHADSISTTNPIKTLADIEYMDEVTPEICGNTPLADTAGNYQYPLKDPRDNQTYTVAKLKDGNCWMTQNMNNQTYNMTFDKVDSSENSGPYDSIYGSYYTFYKATDVCSGLSKWSLPSKDEYNLITENGKNAISVIITHPYNFQFGGRVIDTTAGLNANTLQDAGHLGYYWTSTAFSDDTNGADGIVFGSDKFYDVYPFNNRIQGYSVRCLTPGNGTINPPAPTNPEKNDPNINVTIPNIITLDVSAPSTIPTSANEISTGTFTATVESNQNYSISLNAAGDSTSLINSKDGNKLAEIPTIATAQPTPGISSWGIRVCTSLLESSCNSATYQPLPAKNQTNTFTTGTKGTHQHLFQIGIGIGSELPSGTYTTSIQVTASQK